MQSIANKTSPFAFKNIRMFIAFRIFFNARFYYPVFTILFLDFGLTIAQFALLNAVWAATIVLLEVPSGALADIWGRRNLLILAGVLMIVEMLLLCLVPRGYPGLLFAVFMLNRILSGTAEAAASGADEAIAFDTLKEAGLAEEWRSVLSMQMRTQSIAYIIAMTLGAAVYDPSFLKRLLDWIQVDITLTQDMTIRFPIVLTLCMAVLTLITTLIMEEKKVDGDDSCSPLEKCGVSVKEVFHQTFQAGKWILMTPFALVMIAAGFLFDSVIRMVITLSSQYYRVIEIPEALFGVIGSGIAMLGLVIPRIATKMTEQFTPQTNLLAITLTTIVGLFGMSLFKPISGLIPMVVLFSGMYLTGFFVSHYLNHITRSSQRATVLSFKGLSFNLCYGLIGILYSVLLAWLRPQVAESETTLAPQMLENFVFMKSFQWFPWFFLAGWGIFLVFAALRLKGSTIHRKTWLVPQNEDQG